MRLFFPLYLDTPFTAGYTYTAHVFHKIKKTVRNICNISETNGVAEL